MRIMRCEVFNEVDDVTAARMLEQGVNTAESGGSSWCPPTAEEVNAMLPRYRVECLLEKGGMGAVYRAEQIRLQRLVAIKLIRPDLAADEDFLRWFECEARFLAKLHHARIVSVYDLGQTSSGVSYFVMEYIEGTSLEELLRSDAIAPERALEFIIQICEALHYAHSQGVIHRDLKPGNVLIGLDGMVKLVDFGLARSLCDTSTPCSAVTLAIGTFEYMAPEQRHGVADHRSDIYAVGAILHRMLSGESPHGFLNPLAKRLGLNPSFDEILNTCLHQDPDRRYQSMGDLRRAIDCAWTRPTALGRMARRRFRFGGKSLALLAAPMAAGVAIAWYALRGAPLTSADARPEGRGTKAADLRSSKLGSSRSGGMRNIQSGPAKPSLGTVDRKFNPNPNGIVAKILPLKDGGMLVGGQFKSIAGKAQPCLAKLRSDGTLDESFCSKLFPADFNQVKGLVEQPDGKIVVSGAFNLVGGVECSNIVRLNPDGSVDRGFRASVAGVFCHTVALQQDGKMVLIGVFDHLNGERRRHIGRVNADGSLDSTFYPEANKPVRSVVIQADGKILVGGHFWRLANGECQWLGRLNIDGSLDRSFHATLAGPRSKVGPPGVNGTGVSHINVHPDGRILVAGDFLTAGGMPHSSVVLLRPDGSPDESFIDPRIDTPVSCVAETKNGRIVVGGFFHSVGEHLRSSLALLNPDGSVEKSFLVNAEAPVVTLAVGSDESVLVGGAFEQLGGEPHGGLGRILLAR